jgi:hypothetical protein
MLTVAVLVRRWFCRSRQGTPSQSAGVEIVYSRFVFVEGEKGSVKFNLRQFRRPPET